MCEKCQDKGFTEENHGLLMILCDCEKGKEYRARHEAILGIPKEKVSDKPKALILPHYEGDYRSLEERADEARRIIEASNDNDSGTEPDNKPVGSTPKPRKRRKGKVRKSA